MTTIHQNTHSKLHNDKHQFTIKLNFDRQMKKKLVNRFCEYLVCFDRMQMSQMFDVIFQVLLSMYSSNNLLFSLGYEPGCLSILFNLYYSVCSSENSDIELKKLPNSSTCIIIDQT